MTTKTTTAKLARLADAYLDVQDEIDQLHAKHAAVFRKLADCEQTQRELAEDIKTAARAKAQAGETLQLVSTEEIEITVTGPLAAPTYSLAKARRHWPEDVVKTALVESLDTKMVLSLVGSGSLPAALACKAENPRKELTPAVKINVRKPEARAKAKSA